jgi:ABC-type transport system substrate-binding protein
LIQPAAGEVAEGRWDDEFPLDIFQTGSGTSTNTNANEVIARRAAQIPGVGGIGGPAKNMLPPSWWGYNDAVVDDEYDPVKSRQYLSGVEFTPGDLFRSHETP